MNQYPRVSIITPSLNQGTFIRETIESVLIQNYPNIEYIVMDGGSTDGTVRILKNLQKTNRFIWISKKDRGQADAINNGMKLASGDILCYLNSDDYLLPGALSKVAAIFAQNQRVDWVTGDYSIVNDRGARIQQFVSWYKRMLRMSHVPLLLANSIIQPSTFWRRSLTKRVGLFDSTLQYAFDYDYWLRLSTINPPLVIVDQLSAFRIHKQSKGGQDYRKQFNEELTVLKRYVRSRFIVFLHHFHNQLIILIYDRIKHV